MIIERKRLCDVLAVKSRQWAWFLWQSDRIDGPRDLIDIYRTRREAEDDILKNRREGHEGISKT